MKKKYTYMDKQYTKEYKKAVDKIYGELAKEVERDYFLHDSSGRIKKQT